MPLAVLEHDRKRLGRAIVSPTVARDLARQRGDRRAAVDQHPLFGAVDARRAPRNARRAPSGCASPCRRSAAPAARDQARASRGRARDRSSRAATAWRATRRSAPIVTSVPRMRMRRASTTSTATPAMIAQNCGLSLNSDPSRNLDIGRSWQARYVCVLTAVASPEREPSRSRSARDPARRQHRQRHQFARGAGHRRDLHRLLHADQHRPDHRVAAQFAQQLGRDVGAIAAPA